MDTEILIFYNFHMKYYSCFYFFQTFENMKPICNSQALQKQATHWILPAGYSLPIPDLEWSQNQIHIYRNIYLSRMNFKPLPYLGKLKGL